MTEIQSPSVEVGLELSKLQLHLLDLQNLGPLLPEGKVKDFVGTTTSAKFTIQGGVKIELTRPDDRSWEPDGTLRLEGGGAPFAFHLIISTAKNEAGSSAQVLCCADLNPFLKMMAQKPLNALFTHIVKSLSRQFPV
jgi:hypothetical protein|tara:strand:- start:49 stop:459 length:411 start_codon:yes stop_codon:yes gene_type:complete